MRKTKQPQQPQQLIYLGPTLKKPRLQSNTVFIDRVPNFLKDYKEINELVVPLSEMQKTLKELQDKSSLASYYFAKILETQ